MTVPTGTCFECRDEFELPGYNKDCCSEDCYYKHKGEMKLNLLRYDHRLCASCGRWLKEVAEPPEGWVEDCHSIVEHALDHGGEISGDGGELVLDITECATTRRTAAECVVGFQTRTENAEIVEKEFSKETFQKVYQMGTGCVCGTTDTRTTDAALQGIELATVLANYVHRFRELEREGQLDQRINKEAFFNSYKESENIPYSLGKALQ